MMGCAVEGVAAGCDGEGAEGCGRLVGGGFAEEDGGYVALARDGDANLEGVVLGGYLP
jgi:hypothetical protein